MPPPTVMVVLGTRPEAIKLAPLIADLQDASDLDVVVVNTGQHAVIVDDVLDLFAVRVAHDLKLLQDGRGLTHITTATLTGLEPLLARHRPAAVIVQGDTTTAMSAALAAFYAGAPVVHVEAGLRSGDTHAPHPEELNRQVIGRLADVHLAPTPRARVNLLTEGVPADRVVVTGNTGIDALHRVVAMGRSSGSAVEQVDGPRTMLVTAHRRESLGGGFTAIATAVRVIAGSHPDLHVVWPVHPNPVVRAEVLPVVAGLTNIEVVEPMGYQDFAQTMAAAHLVLTDSGGVQEEAPSLGVPVLVTRTNTERPEAVDAGAAALVGQDPDAIVRHVHELLDDDAVYARMHRAVSPFGDGRAVDRVMGALRMMMLDGPSPEEFVPGSAGGGLR